MTEQETKKRRLKRALILGAEVLLGVLIVLFTLSYTYSRVIIEDVYKVTMPEELHMVPGDRTVVPQPVSVLNLKKEKVLLKKEPDLRLTYESSDEKVVKVDPDGHVTAVYKGDAVITARIGSLYAETKVAVRIPIDRVTFDEEAITAEAGDVRLLRFSVWPEDASDVPETTFTTDRPDILEILDDGRVRVLGPGSGTVTLHCGSFTDEIPVTVYAPLKGVDMENVPDTLNKHDSVQLGVLLYPEDTTDELHTEWSVSDEKIAEIDGSGLLRALAPGPLTITLTVNSFEVKKSLTLLSPMTAIRLSTDKLTIRYGDSVTLPISYEPDDTTDDKHTVWSSSDPAVATVSQEGRVKAEGAGTAVIRAECGPFAAECRITVVVPVTAVNISHTELTIEKGESAQIAASVYPSFTTEDPYINWASDNIKVARVENGRITAVGGGWATIIASHDDITASCRVFVHSPITNLFIDQENVSVVEGFTANLTYTVLPEDTNDDRTGVWESLDKTIATVSQKGVVTAKKPGTCVIKVTVAGRVDSITLTVTPFVEVTSVTLNATQISFANMHETYQLKATVRPRDASENSVTWSSSNNSVATVNSKGKVTAVGGGDCTVTASCGGKSAVCQVHVAAENIVVVLDPGHCSEHTGAEWAGVNEEIINMVVANACKDYLMSHYAGITVYLTHDTVACAYPGHSNGADLEYRCQFAQNMGAAFLVSLHHNMSTHHNASGCVAYVSSMGSVSSASYAIGNAILEQISARTGLQNRGCEGNLSGQYFDPYGNPLDYYAINRHCANRGFPGVIIEHCFMDCDTAYVQNAHWLQEFGIADAIGIANYLGLSPK